MKEMLFRNNVLAGVIIGDQAAGLLTALETDLPGILYQICTWHACAGIPQKASKCERYDRKRRDEIIGVHDSRD
jgi:hypothetical protein